MDKTKGMLLIDLQLFAGEEGTGGDGGAGAGGGAGGAGGNGNGGGTGGGGKTYSEEEAERIAKERAERASNAAMRSYFQQQGCTQEEVEQLLKEHKEKKEKEKTETQREKERADRAENDKKTVIETANKRIIAAEFKVQAVQANIKYVDDALKLADLSGVTIDEKTGEPDKAALKKVIDQLVKEKPFLLAAGPGGVGSASNPGGGGSSDPVEAAKKLAEERNKGTQQPTGGYDPWAKK